MRPTRVVDRRRPLADPGDLVFRETALSPLDERDLGANRNREELCRETTRLESLRILGDEPTERLAPG